MGKWHCRTPGGRLHAFDQAVTSLKTESASSGEWAIVLGENGVTTQEPHREALRSYLMAVRALDTPSEPDLFIPKIIEVLLRHELQPDTVRWLGVMQKRYDDAQKDLLMGEITDSYGTFTPRECFEMLAYRNHLHYDIDREVRAQEMGEFLAEMARQQGSVYANVLTNLALYVRCLGRDDPATAYWFVQRADGEPSAVEWLEINFK